MVSRTRNKRDIPIEHRPITDADRELRRARQTFEQRERARLGLAPRADEQSRSGPSRPVDRDVRRWVDKGYSEEMARELAAAGASVDARIQPRRKTNRNVGGANPTNL
jgi:hypothetical protein